MAKQPTLLRTESMTYEGGTITVQCATILVQMNRADLAARLEAVITRGKEYIYSYAELLAHTTVFKGFPFTLPELTESDDAHAAAFTAYTQLPVDLVGDWLNMVKRVDTPPGAKAELQPGVVSDTPK